MPESGPVHITQFAGLAWQFQVRAGIRRPDYQADALRFETELSPSVCLFKEQSAAFSYALGFDGGFFFLSASGIPLLCILPSISPYCLGFEPDCHSANSM